MANKVILVGNLGKDPESRFTAGGTQVVTFSLATTEKWKASNGEIREDVSWHNVVTFNKLAEICEKHLTKGKRVYVEGKIKYEKYEKDNVTKYITKIHCEKIEFLSPREDKNSGGNQSNNEPPPFDSDDDIPF